MYQDPALLLNRDGDNVHGSYNNGDGDNEGNGDDNGHNDNMVMTTVATETMMIITKEDGDRSNEMVEMMMVTKKI